MNTLKDFIFALGIFCIFLVGGILIDLLTPASWRISSMYNGLLMMLLAREYAKRW